MKLGAVIRSTISYVLLTILFLVILIPTIIFFLLPQKWRYKSKLFFFCQYWAMRASLASLFIPITIKGKENIPAAPVVVVANHQSSLDIPLISTAIGTHPHVWLAWAMLMKSFVYRLFLPKVAVLIDTSSAHKATRSLLTAIATVKHERLHAIIFPEGARYIDDEVHEFFGGFVVLAKRTDRPVLPIRILNANRAFPPGSFLLHWTRIKVVVGPAMYQGAEETDADFKDRVYQWFVQQTGE